MKNLVRRKIGEKILEAEKNYKCLMLIGPRQSGKTTLVKALFGDYRYLSLEDPEVSRYAKNDPNGFFRNFSGNLILDEVQKAPDLLSVIQGIVDEPKDLRRFILTGSENLLISEKISQSLAGRVRIFKLLPLAFSEAPVDDLFEAVFLGGYPRFRFDRTLNSEWMGQYFETYIQKDVRNILNVSNVDQFDRFVRLLANRVGSILDYASLANDAGVSAPTAKSWISILNQTFISFTLAPHFKNFNKRLIKSPKVYFFDTALLCYLLKIEKKEDLVFHAQFAKIFENFVVIELIKKKWNIGKNHSFYFWRDQRGNEVDLIEDFGEFLSPIEIKSSMTFHEDFLKGIRYLNELQFAENPSLNSAPLAPQDEYRFRNFESKIVYGGEKNFIFGEQQQEIKVQSWRDCLLKM